MIGDHVMQNCSCSVSCPICLPWLKSISMFEMAVNAVSSSLKSQTNAHIFRGRPTLKDVEHFRNGSVREFIESLTLRVDFNIVKLYRELYVIY